MIQGRRGGEVEVEERENRVKDKRWIVESEEGEREKEQEESANRSSTRGSIAGCRAG